jgi:hypothetical protein
MESGPYAGLSLREAVLAVLRERDGRKTNFRRIIETLEAGGYAINSDHPSRALHAALIGVKDVERVGKALYRWRNGTSPIQSAEADKGTLNKND